MRNGWVRDRREGTGSGARGQASASSGAGAVAEHREQAAAGDVDAQGRLVRGRLVGEARGLRQAPATDEELRAVGGAEGGGRGGGALLLRGRRRGLGLSGEEAAARRRGRGGLEQAARADEQLASAVRLERRRCGRIAGVLGRGGGRCVGLDLAQAAAVAVITASGDLGRECGGFSRAAL